MKFAVQERLVLPSLLPQEESFVTLKLVNRFKEECSFSEEEHKALKLTIESGGNIKWKPVKDDKIMNKDIEVGDVIKNLLVSKLKELDSEKKIRVEHITLYEKLIEEKDEA